MGYYAYAKLGYRTAVALGSDFPAGREQTESFVRTFTAAGGRVIQQVWAGLGTMDFAPYISQLRLDQADVLWVWFAGAEPVRLIAQLREYGVRKPIVTQGAFLSNYVLAAARDGALGILSTKQYTDVLDTPENRRFVSAYTQKHRTKPDPWAEQGYVGARAVGEAIKAIGGRVEGRQRFLDALRKVKFDGPAGPVWFDDNQQRVVDVYIRKVERSGNEYVNAVVDKIPSVSQGWTPL